MSAFSLFDFSARLEALSSFGDPLERLLDTVNFELFRLMLEEGFDFSPRLQGARPRYDAVLMFKILVLQSLYTLSDDQTEYQIKDRLSFMRFLGLTLSQKVPDAKTIWLYRKRLKKKEMMTLLFGLFDQALQEKGYLAMGGQIVDASIIKAPRQRLTQEEKASIKEGLTPQGWQDQPTKLAHKDVDARWMVTLSKTTVQIDRLTLLDPITLPRRAEFQYYNIQK